MLALVDLENENYSRWEESLSRQLRFKYLIESISGQECLLIRYDRLSPYLLNNNDISGVIVSGNFTDWSMYKETDFAGLNSVYQSGLWPLLGICGGFQLLAQAYGARIGPMKIGEATDSENKEVLFDRVEAEEGVVPSEIGFTKLNTVSNHAILSSLPEKFIVYEYHYWEVKTIPAGFKNIARSQNCNVQFIAHGEKPLFGCEFHPEEFTEDHPHGRQILTNFFNIASEISSNELDKLA